MFIFISFSESEEIIFPYLVRSSRTGLKCTYAAFLFGLPSAAGLLRAFVFLWCSPDLSSLYSVISMVRADSPADKQYSLNSTSLLFSGTSSHHINLPTQTLILWENVYGGITASTRTCNNTAPVYCRSPHVFLSLSLSIISLSPLYSPPPTPLYSVLFCNMIQGHI